VERHRETVFASVHELRARLPGKTDQWQESSEIGDLNARVREIGQVWGMVYANMFSLLRTLSLPPPASKMLGPAG